MKLTERTLKILKNFSTINPGIVFKEGSELSTMSPSKSILAKAKVTEVFEQRFALYDLSKFIATLSLFKDPELEYANEHVVIKSDRSSVKYYFAGESLIITPPDKDINVTDFDVEFQLTDENLSMAIKALSTLGLPQLAFKGENGKVSICALDSSGAIKDAYNLDITTTDKEFLAVFNAENLKVIPDTYDVKISKKGISKWTSNDLVYFVVFEAKASKF